MLDLDAFCVLAAEHSEMWARRGVRSATHRSPIDGRPKVAAWVVLEVADRDGDLIVWDSGEGELSVLGADGQVTQKHFDDLTNDTVRLALDELVALLCQQA